ncbi:hypothetical protein PTTG_30148 [Puccinia triticina 1-1 BBBD Race 1]|uniref:DUF6589 domain-containing protein n=1 Tax=Puccinia triticina (isolate 1-1 / race 1 (BBBD)) TaxID=630390 RepID=A0A180G092_PUCT1|nr:hypothetical protein PTTG_30148 [Puccinia triticina 1-1 BBBD Race 1]
MRRNGFCPQLKTEYQKVRHICDTILRSNLTPKKFLQAFLTNQHIQLALRRGSWGTEDGWPSTLDLLQSIKRLANKTKIGCAFWKDFILNEAKICVNSESPKRGVFPNGTYHSSHKIDKNFFTGKSKNARNSQLIKEDMPFLYELISSKLLNRINPKHQDDPENNLDCDDTGSVNSEDSVEELDVDNQDAPTVEPGHNQKKKLSQTRQEKWACMLWNSVVFVACGVTEQINSYLHYIGLTMSQKTALSALKRLNYLAQKNLARKLLVQLRAPLSPFICIDNIDFEERIHFKSVEKTSHMFHGTWGYVHTLDPSLIEGNDPDNFSMESFKQAIKDSANLKVSPKNFIPTPEQEAHFGSATKSQIAQVMMTYIATTNDPKRLIPLEPPTIDQIRAQKPDIAMMKLMLASDNCAEGIGNVLNDIIAQTNLKPDQFFSELQVMEGDLGTILNLECLRSQRRPSRHNKESLGNIFMLLGAAHTLWNISQAIFLKHFGNNRNQEDLGA